MACVGLGCEAEENMNHYAVMENIATLVKNDGFYGSCSLIKGTDEYNHYVRALSGAQRNSHIQGRVKAAAAGEFGEIELNVDANLAVVVTPEEPLVTRPTINPLMSIYWFFDFDVLAMQNKLISTLAHSESKGDALRRYRMAVTRTRPHKPFVL